MKMTFAGYGSPLVLMLEELGVVTDCSIRTMEPDEPVEIDIRVGALLLIEPTRPQSHILACC
jgi:cell cycle checkpoint protein